MLGKQDIMCESGSWNRALTPENQEKKHTHKYILSGPQFCEFVVVFVLNYWPTIKISH